MVKVQLHGDLGKEFENSWNLDASSVGEVLRAIECQCPNFQEYVINAELNQAQRYYVAVDNKKLLKDEEFFCKFHKNTKKIDILPMVAGSAPAALVFVGKMLLAVAVGAVTSLIVNKLFEPPDPQELKDTNSYLFNAAENTESQGIPVPIAYGKLLIGGKVVSAVNQYSDAGRGSIGRRSMGEPWLEVTAQYTPKSALYFKVPKEGVKEHIETNRDLARVYAGSHASVLNPEGATFNELFKKQRSVNRNSPKE